MSRAVTLGGFALLLLATAVLAGGVVLTSVGSAPSVTITDPSPRVSIGPDSLSEGTDGVVTCMSTGPPPGSYAITGTVTLQRGDAGVGPAAVDLTVRVGNGFQTTRTVDLESIQRVMLYEVTPADGSLSPGQSIDVQITVSHDDRTLDRTTVTVESRQAEGCFDES